MFRSQAPRRAVEERRRPHLRAPRPLPWMDIAITVTFFACLVALAVQLIRELIASINAHLGYRAVA